MRQLSELLDRDDPAWPLVREWIAAAPFPVECLPAAMPQRDEALLQLQVTTRSPMGAVVYETGGLRIDSGWLRVLGSGSASLTRTLPAWNRALRWPGRTGSPQLLVVADDVLGGLFALNGGAFAGELGNVHYFGPDTLDWQNLGVGYSRFLAWSLGRGLTEFYGDQRWPGWQEELRGLSGDQALSIYPFLFTQGLPIGERSRRAVPVTELFDLHMDLRGQLGMAPL